MVTLGGRLKELRNQRNMTQGDVLIMLSRNKVDVSKWTYSKWENNIHEPGYNVASIISEYYDVSLDYLFGKSDIRK